MTVPPLSRARRLIGWIAMVVAALSVVWAVYLLEFSGFDARVLGVKITTHQPWHPMALCAAALIVFFVVNAGRPLRETWLSTARLDDRVVAGGLAVATAIVGLAFSTMAATGSDAYGYASEADLWLSGRLTTPQPWIAGAPWPEAVRSFAPLGYLPQTVYTPNAEPTTIVPTYAPGLPLVMAAAEIVGGHCAAFWVVPLSGGLLVLATFGLGRRMGSSRAGLIAAWLVATSPAFLYMLMWPMTDVPVAAAWAVVFYLLFGSSVRSSAGAGVFAALALLIRPNLAPLIAIPALWLLIRAWRSQRGERWPAIVRLAAFLAGLAPGAITLAVFNWRLYGSPLQSGYADAGAFFSRAHILPNLYNYSAWFVDSQTPIAVAGVLALLLPIARLWPRVPDRRVIAVCALFVAGMVAEYSVFLVFDAWWYLRFLLPCWPFIMVGLASVLIAGVRWSGKPMLKVAVAIAVLILGMRGIRVASDRFAFELWEGEHRYVTAAKLVQSVTDDNSVILSLQHSGSVRYYAGRVSIRFDAIDKRWLDRAVAWMGDRGVHVYLLAEDWELPTFRQLFPGQRTLARLDAPPIFVYTGPATIYLYDLLRPDNSPASVDRIMETYHGDRCVPPAPAGRLVLKQ